MQFKIDDTELEFSILSGPDRGDPEGWADVRISVRNHYINYEKTGELLLYREINRIASEFRRFLTDELSEETRLHFAEPDISLFLVPSVVKEGEQWCILHRFGHWLLESFVHLQVHFADSRGTYVAEMWEITLDRSHVQQLLEGIEKDLGRSLPDEQRYRYVGVSFEGARDNLYWYLDDEHVAERNIFVYVPVGDDSTPEAAHVECVRYYNTSQVPYPLDKIKRIIKRLPEEDQIRLDSEWCNNHGPHTICGL